MPKLRLSESKLRLIPTKHFGPEVEVTVANTTKVETEVEVTVANTTKVETEIHFPLYLLFPGIIVWCSYL